MINFDIRDSPFFIQFLVTPFCQKGVNKNATEQMKFLALKSR